MSLERTPRQIAELLGVDPKAVRHWLRLQGWRSPEEAGTEWRLTAEQALLVHEEFLGRISSATSEQNLATDSELDGFNLVNLFFHHDHLYAEGKGDAFNIYLDDPVGITPRMLSDDAVAYFGFDEGFSVRETKIRTRFEEERYSSFVAWFGIADHHWDELSERIVPFAMEELSPRVNGDAGVGEEMTRDRALDLLYEYLERSHLHRNDVTLFGDDRYDENGIPHFRFDVKTRDRGRYLITVVQAGRVYVFRAQGSRL